MNRFLIILSICLISLSATAQSSKKKKVEPVKSDTLKLDSWQEQYLINIYNQKAKFEKEYRNKVDSLNVIEALWWKFIHQSANVNPDSVTVNYQPGKLIFSKKPKP